MRPTLLRRTAAVALCAFAAVGGTSACSADPGSAEAFCAQVGKLPSLESVLSRFSESDPDSLADRIERARSAYDELTEAAPSEIDSETDDVVALVDEIFAAVEAHPDDPAKAADQLREAMADHPEAEASRAKVAAYAEETCDVQLDPTLSDAGAGASSTTTSTTIGVTTTTG